MRKRRVALALAAGVVAVGGALVALSPAGAQSEPDEAIPEDEEFDGLESSGVDLDQIPEDCAVLIDLEFEDFEDFEDGEMVEPEPDEADIAELTEFAAAARDHLDANGVRYDLITEFGVEFAEPVDDAGWRVLDDFAMSYFEEGMEDGFDDEDIDSEIDIEEMDLDEELIDLLNAEDEALRAHLDERGIGYETEVDDQGVSFTAPVDDADWDVVDEFFDARYGHCEPFFAELEELEACELHDEDDIDDLDESDDVDEEKLVGSA